MADACPGLTFEKLAWASEWYVREETYAKALAEVVNFQHRLPLALLHQPGRQCVVCLLPLLLRGQIQ